MSYPLYVGNCEWILIDEDGTTVAEDVSGRVFTFEGRADKTDEFAAQFTVGTIYQGGYIIRILDRQTQGPFNKIEVHIALAPSFQSSRSPTNWSVKTIALSGSISDSGVYQNLVKFDLRREVIFRSPTVSYTYFASSQPAGPRFSSASGNIRVLSDRIFVNGFDANDRLTYQGTTTYNNLPSALRDPVQLEAKTIAEIQATPIPGTPWWRCVDTVTKEYKTDDDA